MSPNKILAVLTLLTTLTISDFPLIHNPKSKIPNSQVLAQTIDERQAEAHRLYEEGKQQFQDSHFQAALQLWERALVIYEEIGDRQGENASLNVLSAAYFSLGNYPRVINYAKKHLVIAQKLQDRRSEWIALYNLGNAYDSLGNFLQAIEYYEKGLSITRNLQDRRSEGLVLGNLGVSYANLANFPQAIIFFKESLLIAQEFQDHVLEQKFLYNLGFAYFSCKDFPNAIKYYEQSLKLARRLQDRESERWILNELGIAHMRIKNFRKVIEYLQQSVLISRKLRDRKEEGRLLSILGGAYRELGELPQAIKSYKGSLEVAQELEDRRSEGLELSHLGFVYLIWKKFPQAIEYFQQSLAIVREINDREIENLALSALRYAQKQNVLRKTAADQLLQQGARQLQTSQFKAALQSGQQALIIYREINEKRGEVSALELIGVAYTSLKDLPNAIDSIVQTSIIARALNDPRLETGVVRLLSTLYEGFSDSEGRLQVLDRSSIAYFALGDFSGAITFLQRSLEIARKQNNLQFEGSILGNLASVYTSIGNYPLAIKYIQQSSEIARSIKDRKLQGMLLTNLGVISRRLGDLPQAIELHEQGLIISREIQDREMEGKALGNLGRAYIDIGNFIQATEFLQQRVKLAREIRDRQGEMKALENLGSVYEYRNNFLEAINYYKQSLEISQDIQDRDSEGDILTDLGFVLAKSGDFIKAEKLLREAIKIWESLRFKLDDVDKISSFDTQSSTYILTQKVLMAQNKPEEALEIAERGRARALVELLARRNPTTSNSVNSTIDQHTITQPSIELLQQITQQQNATLVEYSIIYDQFKIKDKQEWKESELYIWVIKPTGEVTFRKADLKPLWQQQNTTIAQLVTTSRESIGVRNRSELAKVVVELSPQAQQRRVAQQRQKLQQLHQLLIEPIANLLPTDPQARVIFIPHGELFLVPFPALVDASGQYLIEKHTLLTAPSIEVLNSTRQQRQLLKSAVRHPAPSDVLIVGNPSMPKVWNPNSGKPEQLPYLEGAEKEAQAISNFFHVPALLDEQATEPTIKQRILNARIVHLATHGLLDYGNPQDTGARDFPGAIALAPGDGEDGVLTSTEIQQMKLKAELVVLSACDTGQGRLTGDGVIGLSRSLISAGVPSVIVSLWAVDDAATAELMREFYTQWQHQPDKAQALRQAMLTTMKNHPDPLLWAAFTLIGEAE